MTLIIASALAISVVVISRKSQAQNASSQPADNSGSMTADAVAAKPGNPAGPPIYVTEMPPGYRDWRFISVAHEEGNLHSFAAVLGNDVAIKAYREGKLPFPDGTIIAALHYHHVSSEENNKVFGRDQSFVPWRPFEHSVHDQGL